MKIVGPLRNDNPAHWAVLPEFLRRVQAFCAEQPTEMTFSALRDYIVGNFVRLPAQPLGAILIEDGPEHYVGHTLGSIEARGSTLVAFVAQYQVDRHVPADLRDELMQCLRTWAQHYQVHELECVTWLPPKVFQRYGFTPYRTVMRAPVEAP